MTASDLPVDVDDDASMPVSATGRAVAPRRRRPARHCAELLRPAPGASDLMPLLRRAVEPLTRALAGELAGLLGGVEPLVECSGPEQGDYGDFYASHYGLAAWRLLALGLGAAPLLLSIDAVALLRLVDRTFGGPGTAPTTLPRDLPLSALLVAQRIEAMLATALSRACPAVAAFGGRATLALVRGEASLDQLQPFPSDTALATLPLAVHETGRPPWLIELALPLPTVALLVGKAEAPRRAAGRRAPPDPQAAPWADLPLPVRAVLAETRLPLATVSALAVGQVLAVPVARQVPLRLGGRNGERTIATGTVGAVDDRVAVQINRLVGADR